MRNTYMHVTPNMQHGYNRTPLTPHNNRKPERLAKLLNIFKVVLGDMEISSQLIDQAVCNF